MPRIKIDLPDTFIFHTFLSVRINNINYGGHLGHDAVLSLAHEARVRFFAHLGYSELDVEGAAIILSDAMIVYRSEAFYNDQLSVDIAVEHFTRVGCEFYYLMKNRKSEQEIARIKTGIVFIHGEKHKKVISVPEAFKGAIERLKNIPQTS